MLSHSDMARWCYLMSLTCQLESDTAAAIEKSTRGLSSRRFQAALKQLAGNVRGGQLLSEAMESKPAVFPLFMTRMVRLGEQSGRLAYAFDVLAQYWETMVPAQRRLQFAWIFPLAFAGGVTGIMVLVASLMFEIADATRPLPWLIMTGIVLVVLDVALIDRVRAVRVCLDYLSAHVPLWGKAIVELGNYTFASNMGLYYQAGTTSVTEKWRGAAQSVPNLALSDQILRGVAALEEGQPLAEAMRRSGVFEQDDIELVEREEQLGEFDRMFRELSDRARKRAANHLRLFCFLTHRFVVGLFALFMVSLFFIVAIQSASESELRLYVQTAQEQYEADPDRSAVLGAFSLNHLVLEESKLLGFAIGSLQVAPPLVMFLMILAVLFRPRRIHQAHIAGISGGRVGAAAGG